MKNYLGLAAIKATLPLGEVVAELSHFLEPFVLRETDKFDEVPGFSASSGGIEITIQGIPEDLTPEQRCAESEYYFELRCSSEAVDRLPGSLTGFPLGEPEEPNGYSYVSAFLCERLRALTSLECNVFR